jgi:hypothetical protein
LTRTSSWLIYIIDSRHWCHSSERGPELIRLTWHDPEVLKPEITTLYHKPLQVKKWDKALG